MKKVLQEESVGFPTPSDILKSLQKIHDRSTLTWLQIADKLGISEAYIHRIRKGEQKFSRKIIAKLFEIDASLPVTFGEIREQVSEVYTSEVESEIIKHLRGEIEGLKLELSQARDVIHNQSVAMANMGRSPAAHPPHTTSAVSAPSGGKRRTA